MATKSKSTKDSEEPTAKELRAELAEQIVAAREDGMKWEEIATQFKTSTGKAMLLHAEATVRPKDRIKGASDEELGGKIAAARDEDKLSWGQIMARSGLSETKCRNLYTAATGDPTRGHRIGKGGRYPNGQEPPANEKAPAKAKKAPAKKAPAKKASSGLKAAAAKIAKIEPDNVEGLSKAVVGKTVSFKNGRKQTRVKVADLLDITGAGPDMELTIADADDNEATVVVKTITGVAAR